LRDTTAKVKPELSAEELNARCKDAVTHSFIASLENLPAGRTPAATNPARNRYFWCVHIET